MRRCWTTALALAALCVASTLAHARPPTVMNSPGYDARLQESRKALGGPPATTAPESVPVAKSKRSKKKQPN
ncbi:hypothetical protein [Bradyrhizobium sp. 930_D9_N1_4]|uniref:hypothetical protein n=1 Tax=Bradyrhizobium sp. 930_D9_N1_4 TaxID=3240374 RepID=UPI003F8CE474